MSDPGLGAVNAVDIAVAYRAGLQAGEVGAGIRLGKDGGRQYRAGRDCRQPARLLRVGATEADQLAGDFRAGAERADPDISARQLFGDDAHRRLAEPEPAMFFGDRHPEDADASELFDDRQRDQLVAAMPLLSKWRDLPLAEAAHLIANHFEGRIIDADVSECAVSGGGEPAPEPQTGC